MVTITTYGDNPSVPSSQFNQYVPDQLIAGDAKLVTQSVVVTGGAALLRGTVMGMVTVGAAAAAVAASGNTGNGTISSIALGTKAKVGAYTIVMTGATTYNVIDPSGLELAPGTAAGSYGVNPADPEIHFTFTAGATPMVAGDKFSIVVAAGAGSWRKAIATAVDGSQNPVGILVDDADASGGDVNGGVYLTGEFNQDKLIYDGGFTLAGLSLALRPYNIHLKSPVSAADPT